MTNALEVLQENNIMHRDLKPMNVMLDENYNVKLIDFGDAKDINERILEDEDLFEHSDDDGNFEEEDEEVKRDDDDEDNILLKLQQKDEGMDFPKTDIVE